MCVIIYKPAGEKVNLETLEYCWEKNDDGGGMMFPTEVGLKICKGFMKWKSFKKWWIKHGEMAEFPVVLHFRIATHGSVRPANTHPFVVRPGGLAVAHNGVIHKLIPPKDTDLSDSENLVLKVIEPIYAKVPDFLDNEVFKVLIEDFIGTSKLAFMDNVGKVTLLNEKLGVWDNGIWFSNSTYKKYDPPKTWSYGAPHTGASYGYGKPAQSSNFGGFPWTPNAALPKTTFPNPRDDDDRFLRERCSVWDDYDWQLLYCEECGADEYAIFEGDSCSMCKKGKLVTWENLLKSGTKAGETAREEEEAADVDDVAAEMFCPACGTRWVVPPGADEECEDCKGVPLLCIEDAWECLTCYHLFINEESSGKQARQNCPECNSEHIQGYYYDFGK